MRRETAEQERQRTEEIDRYADRVYRELRAEYGAASERENQSLLKAEHEMTGRR